MALFDFLFKQTNSPLSGELVFHSNVHQRYESGEPVRGEQIGCHRDVQIKQKSKDSSEYSITIVNADAPNSMFGVTMSTKPMKIISSSSDKVELKGVGYDRNAVMMGVPMEDASFECYSMTILLKGGKITNCILHMLDRNIDIDYYIK